MLQYIINTSIIWLASLLLYELLLKKESFHQYNRIYLLASIAAGLLLPMANVSNFLPAKNTINHPAFEQAFETQKVVFVNEVHPFKTQLSATQPTVAVASANPVAHFHFNIQMALWIIYFVVAFVGLLLLIREAVRLLRLYRMGNKNSEPGCTIVETGKGHGPFSFFKIIFIKSRSDYNDAQWAQLLAHEKEHGRQLHSLDNIVLIFLRIVFWFHPLPHIYFKRLKTVHEYQADSSAAINPVGYGAFLLEQSLLQGAPILSHSFNYSPIKNRIAMLTETRSTRAKLLKYLTIIPLSLILIVFCTQTSFSGESRRSGNKAYFKGNEIEFKGQKLLPFEYIEALQKQKDIFQYAILPDSIQRKDPVTGQVKTYAVPIDTTPVAINGKPIFGNEQKYKLYNGGVKYAAPVFIGAEKNLEAYFFSNLKEKLNQLENGSYTFTVNKLVIDDKGNVAYYESAGISALPGGQDDVLPVISNETKNAVGQKLHDLLEGAIKFKPALQNGKPVNVRLGLNDFEIDVKNHIAHLNPRGGC